MFEEDILKSNTFDALCVVLCTDEPKYIDTDSHYLHIPEQLFVKYTTNLNLSNICFELSNPLNNKKIYLRKIEPSQGEFKLNILVPNWVQNQLGIQMCGSQIVLRPVSKPPTIHRCKIKGNNSSYVKMDIKSILEEKINQFFCLNINTTFNINGVIFTIIELVSTQDKIIDWGIVLNELEIDFDTPDDIKFIEKRKNLIDIITSKIEDKINLINKQKCELGKKKTGIFKFSNFVSQNTELENLSNQQIDWDELSANITKDLEKEYSNNFKEFELNKNILGDLIEEGKNIQKKIAKELKEKPIENKSTLNLFNTKSYKLNTLNTDNKQLTLEEIRKARLSKLV